MKKKFVVQMVSAKNPGYSEVAYRDILDGDFNTQEEAERHIEELIYKIPFYDYRIDERYVR